MRLAAVTLLALLTAPLLAVGQTTTPAPAGRTNPAPVTGPATASPAVGPSTPLPANPPGAATTQRRAAAATAAPAGSADEATAKQKCGTDAVVWSNPGSKVYHTSDSRYYGKTKKGTFMCMKDATSAGYHAAKSAVHAKKPAASAS